jgi:hypothetical protein
LKLVLHILIPSTQSVLYFHIAELAIFFQERSNEERSRNAIQQTPTHISSRPIISSKR